MKLAMKATDTCLKTTTNNNTYALFCIMSFFAVIALHARTSPTPCGPRGRPPCAAAVAAILAPRRGPSPSRAAFPRSRDGRARRALGGPPVGTSVVPPLPLRGGGPLRPRRRDPLHPRAAGPPHSPPPSPGGVRLHRATPQPIRTPSHPSSLPPSSSRAESEQRAEMPRAITHGRTAAEAFKRSHEQMSPSMINMSLSGKCCPQGHINFFYLMSL